MSQRSWTAAYPPLWEAGMIIARLRLAGRQFDQDRVLVCLADAGRLAGVPVPFKIKAAL